MPDSNGAAVTRNSLEIAPRIETRQRHDGHAIRQRDHGEEQAVHVVQRRGDYRSIRRGLLNRAARKNATPPGAAPRGSAAPLWDARRAGGVENLRKIARRRIERWHLPLP